MPVAPTPNEPPWPYQASKILRSPRHPLTFDEFRRRVRKFSRIGLVMVGTRMAWYAWDHPELLDPSVPGGIGNLVTQIYTERIVTLACIVAPDDPNRPWPSEIDFRLLCWEMHTSSDATSLGTEALKELATNLQALPASHPLQNVDGDKVRGLLAVAFKGRLAYEQGVGRRWEHGDLLRPWLVTRELSQLARQAKGNRYDEFEQLFFLTSLDGFVRSSWAVLTKASEGVTLLLPDGSSSHERGRFQTSDWPEKEPNFERLDMTTEDTRVVAHRLATTLGEYVAKRSELGQLPSEGWKHHELLDWLSTRPIVDIDYGGLREHLLMPSPWRFLSAMGNLIEREFVQFLQNNRAEAIAGKDAFSLRGRAFANYLRHTLARTPALTDLDAIPAIRGVKPDFIWLGQDHAILIEAKVLLKPNDDRRLLRVASVVETWRRCAEAITQASGFLQNGVTNLQLSRIPKHWSLVIVSNEPLVEDATGFRSVALAGKLLDGTGIDSLALLTTSELEAWAFSGTADELGERVLRSWNRLDPANVVQDFRIGRPKNAPETLPHIEAAWEKLLGPDLLSGRSKQ